MVFLGDQGATLGTPQNFSALRAKEKFPEKKSSPSALPLANSAIFQSANSANFPLANSANFSLLLDTKVSDSNLSQVAVFEQKGHEIPIALAGAPPLSTVGGGTKINDLPYLPLVQPETHKGGT